MIAPRPTTTWQDDARRAAAQMELQDMLLDERVPEAVRATYPELSTLFDCYDYLVHYRDTHREEP